MKAIISLDAYKQYLHQFFYTHLTRSSVRLASIFFIIFSLIDYISSPGQTLSDLGYLVPHTLISVLLGCFMGFIFIPHQYKQYAQNVENAYLQSTVEEGYSLFLPCQFIRSGQNFTSGILYIGPNKIYFKPRAVIYSTSTTQWDNLTQQDVYIEPHPINLLLKLLYKQTPTALCFKHNGQVIKLLVPYGDQILSSIILTLSHDTIVH